MARPFTSRDAKRLIDEHRELKTRLSKAEAYSDHCKTSISKASEALVAQEVLNVLKDIPIEEINRDKRGFRIKALRDYGYNSIADISTASV